MSWWARWRAGLAPAAHSRRWLVLDVETTGLNPRQDRLLAVAAVAVQVGPQQARVVLGDSFEAVLRQPAPAGPPDKANILLHGIGLGEQSSGRDAAQALREFQHFAAGAPLVAYHAAFDRAVLQRACAQHLDTTLSNPWLDLADLAPVLHPQVKAQALDDWLAHFGIACLQRHQAAADTLATAELLLRLGPALRRACPGAGYAQVARLAAQRRWLA